MKIKVKQDFRDRSADIALRKKGEVLDVSEQRAKELTAKGFAAEVKPKQNKKFFTAWILSVFCPTRFDIF